MKIIAPNAFLVFESGKPLRVISFGSAINVRAVISSKCLKWNTSNKGEFNSDYKALIDHLAENLPDQRKFKGGIFFIQIFHAGKLIPWRINDITDKVAVFYAATRKPDDIMLQSLMMRVGEYAGDDLKTLILGTTHHKTEAEKSK